MQHLLSVWPELMENLSRAKRILFLADYDGTLTPIVATPDLAIIGEETRNLLEKLANHPRFIVGIISGRELTDLKSKVNVEGLVYAGNHGLEIESPKGSLFNPVSGQMRTLICTVGQVLGTALASIKGVFVEDKGLTLSVHYRLVDEANVETFKDKFEKVVNGIKATGKVSVSAGKKVYEVKPAINWDKGKAIKLLMKMYGKGGWKSGLLPIYIGDDTTDEDGFKVIERYRNGVTIFVGEESQASAARYFLGSTDEVTQFLKKLLKYAES